MIVINKESVPFRKKFRAEQSKQIQIIERKEDSFQVIQTALQTRIRRYRGQKYTNTPSREIKKWFEARRI